MAGGWWLVANGWWLVAGGWWKWLVVLVTPAIKPGVCSDHGCFFLS
jgi:hypothetical protein